MNRLCSLSILSSTGSSSKTAILNASATKLVFPKLEEMAAEIIERTDIAPVTTDKKKSLTFIHLGFAQLLSYLCLESEEFVRFSSVSASPFSSNSGLNLSILRSLSGNDKVFASMISSYFWKEKTVIKGNDLVQLQSLQCLLHFFSIPNLNLRTCLSENVLAFNDALETANFDYEIFSNGKILKINEAINENRILDHVKKIQELILSTDNEDIVLAQLDLLKHKLLSASKMLKGKRNVEMTDADKEWISNCIK